LNFSKFVSIRDNQQLLPSYVETRNNEIKKLIEEKLPTTYSSLTCGRRESEENLFTVVTSISEFQKNTTLSTKFTKFYLLEIPAMN